jgi:hypothetical protein
MPPTPWTVAPPEDVLKYEKNRQAGRPPDQGFRPWGVEERSRLVGSRDVPITTEYYVDWTVQPPPAEVTEKCSQCPTHVHTVVGDVPVAEQKHAAPGYWLERSGLRFDQATVTGTELKREVHTYSVPALPPPSRRTVIVAFWSKRTVDEVKTGIEWQWGDTMFPCVDGRPFSDYASLSDLEPMLAAALADADLVAEGQSPLVLLTAFLPLLGHARGGRAQPSLHVVREGAVRYVVLSEKQRGGKLVEVARQRLALVRGTNIVTVANEVELTR